MKIINLVWVFVGILCIGHSISLSAQDAFPPIPTDFPPMELPPAATPLPTDIAPQQPLAQIGSAPAPGLSIPAPDIQSDQLKWPDTIELSETQDSLAKTGNKAMLTLFNNTEKITKGANEKINMMTKSYEDFSKKLDSVNTQIDKFLQETAFITGKVKEQTSPSLTK